MCAVTAVTPTPWGRGLQHPMYATAETYQRAASWVQGCATVADWGGGSGYLAAYLSPSVTYRCIDGTPQGAGQVLADLATYHEVSDGIVLRHVLDNTPDWASVLLNALASFRCRLVVVTFTPDSPVTHIAHVKSGWPIWSFNPGDLRQVMGHILVRDETIQTTHPERIYYLERGLA